VISSHHSRITCECNKEEINDDDDDDGRPGEAWELKTAEGEHPPSEFLGALERAFFA